MKDFINSILEQVFNALANGAAFGLTAASGIKVFLFLMGSANE
jgi:hypothetical protein